MTAKRVDSLTAVTQAECFHLNEILGDKSLPGCQTSSTRPKWWRVWKRDNATKRDSDPVTTVTDQDCARLLGLLAEEMRNVDHADDHLPVACRNYIGKTKVL
ncbi:hypothetical protein IV203_018155 [Nitzschia inconspicua]|uniref:Uncharacterized protein n=1 Tax=Nitzschia inconspicua TaxID=303405 RepID=A0A9K3Q5B8_9STRA|nr:hypothetical protein IV203_018155 [Nitzschia inconspicua]